MDENRGPALLGTTLALGITTFCIVTLRIWFRVYKKRADASDVCLAIALATSICQEAFNANCVIQWGYGQHKANLPPNIVHSGVPLKLYWLNQIFFKVTTLFTKLSLCIAYLGIFQRANSRLVRWTRIVNYTTALIIITYYGAAFIVSIFQCTPVSKTWQGNEVGTCIDLTKFRYATASVNIITSILVIATPLPVLFRVKQRGSEVTQVIILILLGLIHTGCTIARLVFMLFPDPATKTDPQWTSLDPNTLSIVEMDIGIIATSLVVMRPFFKAVLSTLFHCDPRSKRSAHGGTRDGKWRGKPSWNDSGSSNNRFSTILPKHAKPRCEEGKILCTVDIHIDSCSVDGTLPKSEVGW